MSRRDSCRVVEERPVQNSLQFADGQLQRVAPLGGPPTDYVLCRVQQTKLMQ